MGGEVPLKKIVSGGQTGVDRAALDAAMEKGISVGGWCPKGRRAEDGEIQSRYPLRETPSHEYEERTSWNVRDSDATLILVSGNPVGGTHFTMAEARRLGRPHLSVDPFADEPEPVVQWLQRLSVGVLNVAGPRESTRPGIYAAAADFMGRVLARLQ